jgi:hypothetical protein
MKILSIDAWASPDGGWDWNQWFHVGDIDKEEFEELKTNRQYIKWFRDNEYITKDSAGKVGIHDDQYNIVLIQRKDGMPLFAIEYGPEYN